MHALSKESLQRDDFKAFLTKNADYTDIEEYPILDESKILNDIPDYIVPFDKVKEYKGNKKKTAICFYCQDRTFLKVIHNPNNYIKMFKEYKGIIGFDLSIYTDMPIIKQKEQINENLSYTYYFGNCGICYYPNIRCGNDETIDEFLETIPKNSIIAIGTYGFIKTNDEKFEWYYFLNKILPILKPKCILVYGTLNDRLFDNLKQKYNFKFYKPRTSTFFEEYKKHGNKR